MGLRAGNLSSFCSLVLVVTFLVLLRSQEGQGCRCPSCHYSSATQNCQCCVFRQLGKRFDPAMTPDLDHSSSPVLTRYLSRPISDDLASRLANVESIPSSDWSPKHHPNFFYYGGVPGSDVRVTSNQGSKPALRDGFQRYPRVYSKLATQLRLLDSMNLDGTLENGNGDELFSYK